MTHQGQADAAVAAPLLGEGTVVNPTTPTFVRALPPQVRALLSQRCGGDWSRVTQEPDGSVIVHNHPQSIQRRMATARTVELPPEGETRTQIKNGAKKAAKKPTPKPPQVPAVTPATPKPRAKKAAKKAAPPSFSEPSVPVPLAAAPVPPPVPAQREPQWQVLPGSGEEQDPEKLAGAVYTLAQVCANGLPPEYPVTFHEDVLALSFVNPDEAETAMRHPERVVVAEQSREKGYPVLRFHKGSVTVVVGFKSRTTPSIIAVYYAETIARNGEGAAGGGGKRQGMGVPKTTSQLIKALRELGVEFDTEEEHPVVTFAGNDLGKITLTRVRQKAEVESDWQRIQRKVAAIRNRKE